ncbi:MAG: HdeD family acid-resistance protein [Solirubrobacteraceae bacterium]
MSTQANQAPDLSELEAVGRSWWIALLLGLISVGVGILALAYPGETLTTIAIIFGIYLLIAAVIQLVLAFGEGERSRGALLLSAAVAGIAGLIVIRHPGGSVQVVALAFGIYLVVMGIMRLFASAYAVQGRGWLILWGLVDFAAGVVIVAWPQFGVATLAVVIAIVLLARGIVMCALAFALRSAGHELRREQSHPSGGPVVGMG